VAVKAVPAVWAAALNRARVVVPDLAKGAVKVAAAVRAKVAKSHPIRINPVLVNASGTRVLGNK
jgi:hypothetical protein